MKVFAKCDGCQTMAELGNVVGRPDGWASVDVEAPSGRVSLVLCPGCGEAKLGPLLHKPKEAPSVG